MPESLLLPKQLVPARHLSRVTVDPSKNQYLFVYGTLRSDQPEHRTHSPRSLSRSIASVTGTLYELEEGYPLLSVPAPSILLSASRNWLGDWNRATMIDLATVPGASQESTRIRGELIEIPLEPEALNKPDKWEGFSLDRPSIYQRVIVPATLEDGRMVAAWAYVATQIPATVKLIPDGFWERPHKLR